jgi:hypothetical protein
MRPATCCQLPWRRKGHHCACHTRPRPWSPHCRSIRPIRSGRYIASHGLAGGESRDATAPALPARWRARRVARHPRHPRRRPQACQQTSSALDGARLSYNDRTYLNAPALKSRVRKLRCGDVVRKRDESPRPSVHSSVRRPNSAHIDFFEKPSQYCKTFLLSGEAVLGSKRGFRRSVEPVVPRHHGPGPVMVRGVTTMLVWYTDLSRERNAFLACYGGTPQPERRARSNQSGGTDP